MFHIMGKVEKMLMRKPFDQSLMAGHDPETGELRDPKLELVRVTILYRVYTRAQMDATAEAIEEVWWNRDKATGFRLVYRA
jgi:tyrosine phenol-lyase